MRSLSFIYWSTCYYYFTLRISVKHIVIALTHRILGALQIMVGVMGHAIAWQKVTRVGLYLLRSAWSLAGRVDVLFVLLLSIGLLFKTLLSQSAKLALRATVI